MNLWPDTVTADRLGTPALQTDASLAKTPARRSSRRRAAEVPRTPDLLEGEPCPKDGCTLFWPRWHDGQPKCKLCALDESLAALAAHGGLTHRPRKGKAYTPPRTQMPSPVLEERPVWWDEEES